MSGVRGDKSALRSKIRVLKSRFVSDRISFHTHVQHRPMLSLRRVPTTMVQSVETTCLTLVFKRITDVDRQLFRKKSPHGC